MRDQEARGRLVYALRECGLTTKPQKLADAICTLINQKIEHSEGRHHSKFHKTAAETPAAVTDSVDVPEAIAKGTEP